MQSNLKNLDKSSFLVAVTHTTEEIEKAKTHALAEIGKKTKMPGFRPGHVPSDLLLSSVDQNFLNSEVMKHLINASYPDLMKEHGKTPICQPKITVTKFVPFTDLEYTVEIAEKPEVVVGDFKSEIKKQAKKITGENSQEEILNCILNTTKIELPELLVEEEKNRMLGRLYDQISGMGITMEQYLESKKYKPEDLEKEYKALAEKTLKAELAFAEIVSKEGITVTDSEVEATIAANPDETSRKAFADPANRWYIVSVIQRQKLLENLFEVAKGEEN